MVAIRSEDIVAVDLEVNRTGRGPDERSHFAVADRLPFDRRFCRRVVNEVSSRDNGTVVHLQQRKLVGRDEFRETEDEDDGRQRGNPMLRLNLSASHRCTPCC